MGAGAGQGIVGLPVMGHPLECKSHLFMAGYVCATSWMIYWSHRLKLQIKFLWLNRCWYRDFILAVVCFRRIVFGSQNEHTHWSLVRCSKLMKPVGKEPGFEAVCYVISESYWPRPAAAPTHRWWRSTRDTVKHVSALPWICTEYIHHWVPTWHWAGRCEGLLSHKDGTINMVTLKYRLSYTNVASALWREEDHFDNHNNKDNNRLL